MIDPCRTCWYWTHNAATGQHCQQRLVAPAVPLACDRFLEDRAAARPRGGAMALVMLGVLLWGGLGSLSCGPGEVKPRSVSPPAADVPVPEAGMAGEGGRQLVETAAAEAGGAQEGATMRSRVDDLLDAIRQVETGGEIDPSTAVGDGGRARGPYQIHRAYWQDALRGQPLLSYDRYVGDDQTCRHVIVAYWRRYAPEALAYLEAGGDGLGVQSCMARLARIHNGGPAGGRKPATLAYWHKVRAAMPGT